MNNSQTEWWRLIRDVLATEWGYDPATLGLDTVLFADSPAPWMEWVEVIQAIMDRTGMRWPQNLNPRRVRTPGDLCAILTQGSEWPHAG